MSYKRLNKFKRKAVQGLYHYIHYENPKGAWFQISIDTRRKEVIYCESPTKPFKRFNNMQDLNDYLNK